MRTTSRRRYRRNPSSSYTHHEPITPFHHPVSSIGSPCGLTNSKTYLLPTSPRSRYNNSDSRIRTLSELILSRRSVCPVHAKTHAQWMIAASAGPFPPQRYLSPDLSQTSQKLTGPFIDFQILGCSNEMQQPIYLTRRPVIEGNT